MATAESRKRKVLIVSFLFPPLNDIGALRVGKFAKYLPQFGWEPIVLTVNKVKGKPQTLPVEIDEANIVRTPYFDLGPFIQRKLTGSRVSSFGTQTASKNKVWKEAILKVLRSIRPIYTLPIVDTLAMDPIGWYPYAVKKGLDIISKHKFDVIFSSYNPSTSHFIAARLHQRTGIPWVAEFRDPWVNPYNERSRFYQFWQRKLEKKTMKGSNLLIAVSEPVAEQLEAYHSKKVITIHNGFDEEDYSGDVPLTSKFTLTHTGIIYPGKRDPTLLFEVLKDLRQEGKISSDNFEVRFFGGHLVATLPPLIENYQLEDMVRIHGFIPFKESIRRQKESSVLLLLEWDSPLAAHMYPAKMFEYLGARRPILAIAFKGGVIDKLLPESGCGVVVNEVDGIKGLLSKWLKEFGEQGRILSHYSPDSEIMKRYTRREEARKLASAFDEVIGSFKGK